MKVKTETAEEQTINKMWGMKEADDCGTRWDEIKKYWGVNSMGKKEIVLDRRKEKM